jgi:hypothetical protein
MVIFNELMTRIIRDLHRSAGMRGKYPDGSRGGYGRHL